MFYALRGQTGFADFCEYRGTPLDRIALLSILPCASCLIYGSVQASLRRHEFGWVVWFVLIVCVLGHDWLYRSAMGNSRRRLIYIRGFTSSRVRLLLLLLTEVNMGVVCRDFYLGGGSPKCLGSELNSDQSSSSAVEGAARIPQAEVLLLV